MIESSSVLSHQINHNIRHRKLNPFLGEEKRERGRKGEGEKSTHVHCTCTYSCYEVDYLHKDIRREVLQK